MPRRMIAMTGFALGMLGAFGLTSGGLAYPEAPPASTQEAAPVQATPPAASRIPEWLAIPALFTGFGLVALAAWTRRRDD